MKDSYQPTPFEQRASQNLTAWGYIRDYVSVYLLPVFTAAAGWLVGRTQKMDAAPLVSGTAGAKDFAQLYQEELNKIFGGKGHKGGIYAAYAAKIGMAAAVFLLWRREEKKRLEVKDVMASVKDIAPLHQTNEDLEKDSALVKKMIAFEQEKQQRLAGSDTSHRQRLEEQTPVTLAPAL